LALRSRWWINVLSSVAFGFGVGTVPATVLTWPVQHPKLQSSASVNGVPTIMSGIITPAEWAGSVEPLIHCISFGLLGWVTLIRLGAC
jgi:hypothetical protein